MLSYPFIASLATCRCIIDCYCTYICYVCNHGSNLLRRNGN